MASSRIIRVDIKQPATPVRLDPLHCIGAARALDARRADWQEQARRLRKECGFRYLRFHGLYDDAFGLCKRDTATRQLRFNFTNVDTAYDAVLAAGLKPFVELGLMPAALASGEKTSFWWMHNVTPPREISEWEQLIEATLRHWVARYGIEEVSSWYFEVWNEPNLGCFWTGTPEDYLRLYEVTAHAVKRVSPRLRVGGPSSAGNGGTKELLDYCARTGAPLDFVSNHGYGSKQEPDVWGTKDLVLDARPESCIDCFSETRAWIDASAFPGVEFHLTEFGPSWAMYDPIKDTHYAAAWMAYKLKQLEPLVDSCSYWTFTDIFEEPAPVPGAFPGLFGACNIHGLRKPVWHLYALLKRLSSQPLASNDSASWAAGDAAGVRVLWFDHRFPNPGTNKQHFTRPAAEPQIEPALIEIYGLAPGRWRVVRTRVGRGSNDVYGDWIDAGAPNDLTPLILERLSARNSLACELLSCVEVGADGVLRHEAPMCANDLCLLECEPA